MLAVCLKQFFPPIDIQQALVQHAQCPCRFVILATKALSSQASRQVYIYTSHTRGMLTRVASGLFSWSMVAGLLAFSSRQYTPTIHRGPLSASHYFSFLGKRSGRRRLVYTYLDFFSERARLAPPWPLTSSHLNTASVYYLLDLSSFFFAFSTFFCTTSVFSFFRFFVFSFLLFRLC